MDRSAVRGGGAGPGRASQLSEGAGTFLMGVLLGSEQL